MDEENDEEEDDENKRKTKAKRKWRTKEKLRSKGEKLHAISSNLCRCSVDSIIEFCYEVRMCAHNLFDVKVKWKRKKEKEKKNALTHTRMKCERPFHSLFHFVVVLFLSLSLSAHFIATCVIHFWPRFYYHTNMVNSIAFFFGKWKQKMVVFPFGQTMSFVRNKVAVWRHTHKHRRIYTYVQ